MTTHVSQSRSPVVLNPLCVLRDKSEDGVRSVPISVTADSDWVAIRPHGYGEAEAMDGHGDAVLLEVWEGELRLLVATDINESNKAVVSLEGARENGRRRHPEHYRPAIDEPDHYEHRWRTVVAQVQGMGAAGALALQLLTKRLWFRCTSLPTGEFEFAVKAEHAPQLIAWAACSARVE